MIRRTRNDDGTTSVITDKVARLYRDTELLESRALTAAERAEFEAWQDAQPAGAEARATREAHAAAVAAERATAEKLTTVRTLPELVAALVAQRTKGST